MCCRGMSGASQPFQRLQSGASQLRKATCTANKLLTVQLKRLLHSLSQEVFRVIQLKGMHAQTLRLTNGTMVRFMVLEIRNA